MSDQDNWSCAADFLDDIEVDKDGKCKWTDVANAQTHIRMALRHAHSEEVAKLRSQLVKARAALETIEREDRMWTQFPGGREVLDRSHTGNVKIRHRYGQIAHDALSSLTSAYHKFPGAAFAEPLTVTAENKSGDARPNRELDSPDRGQVSLKTADRNSTTNGD